MVRVGRRGRVPVRVIGRDIEPIPAGDCGQDYRDQHGNGPIVVKRDPGPAQHINKVNSQTIAIQAIPAGIGLLMPGRM